MRPCPVTPDGWRLAQLTDWARLYQELLGELGRLANDPAISSEQVRAQLLELIQTHRARRPRSRAEIDRAQFGVSVRHVTEQAVMASELEQLPDLHGFLKVASNPAWMRVVLTPSLSS